jgi:carotenoid cleavage dioxygenase-like enzyme
LKEDSHAMEIHPRTLETLGEWDYRGKLRSQTMTAHPRFDPQTGEMYFFGYEAGGLASRDVSYCIANKDGELVHEEWFQAPYCSLMHDFVVTQEHVIFPVFPITADLERMQGGGTHWIFEPGKESFVGIMPRRGSVKDMRWFRGPARSAFHYMNAFTEGSRVHMDFGCGKMVPFPFIREASGIQMRPEEMAGSFVRWSFDLSKPGERYEESVLGPAGDMPRTSNKDQMRNYGIGYYQSFDPTLGPPNIAGPVGAGFNTIVRIEIPSGRMKRFVPGGPTTVQEHVHIPSKQPKHEGYLGFIVDRHADNLSEFVLLEAEHPDKGPLARVQIPLRLRVGVHGNWVPAENL